MHRRMPAFTAIFPALLLTACSDKSAPNSHSADTTSTSAPIASPSDNDPNVTHAKLNANGVMTRYAARFADNKLVSIEEQREPRPGTTLSGEYTFEGARLMHYRGAKVTTPAALELQFDTHGALQSGRGADVTDNELAAIRNRAQLLRSHALAQRAAHHHSNGY